MLNHVKDSIYGPEFYKKQKGESLGQAFGYFFKLLLLVSAITVLIFAIVVIPKISKFASNEFAAEVTSYYPADLQVTIKGGHASSNMSEPYSIAIPTRTNTQTLNTTQPAANLLVIDTTHPLVIEDFAKYRTLLLLTKDYVVSQDRNGKISATSLRSMPDVVINKVAVGDFLTKAVPYIKMIIPFVLIGFYIGIYIYNTIAYLFVLLISSLILWIVYKVQKKHLSYRTCFKLGLYATTAAIVIDLVFSMASLHIAWYIDLIVILIVVLANVHEGDSSH